jgi:hypothetical protein
VPEVLIQHHHDHAERIGQAAGYDLVLEVSDDDLTEVVAAHDPIDALSSDLPPHVGFKIVGHSCFPA